MYKDDRLLSDPDLVARDESVAWLTAFWYWNTIVGLNQGVQKGEFGVSTKLINGAIECSNRIHSAAKKRFELYRKVLIALNILEVPIEKGCYN